MSNIWAAQQKFKSAQSVRKIALIRVLRLISWLDILLTFRSELALFSKNTEVYNYESFHRWEGFRLITAVDI